ncbi:archemetzincin [Sulfolobus sp. S-194]|uniref:archaemetzincin family Zn-dependent metalloprotease n=1 Tax=Sulfolobus sp. S-194 TaxID=2512240 RepID=UPI001436E25B|nr:archaemetzincin family Zn-dependent metalloprotease [Sulfolobus sp. S-194]QIW23261.1 archemetzincin [Sulfolobus sp. S-194]
MYKVLIVKITSIDRSIINEITNHLSQLGFHVDVLNQIEHINISYFDWQRSQYDAEKILEYLSSKFDKFPYDAIIAIGDIDAYARGLNFVFGLSTRKFGTVFLVRLKNDFYKKKCNFELFIERVKKEVTHELGHTLGLGHCSNPTCVMRFSNSITEVDNKSAFFCEECRLKLNINYKS